MSRAKLGLWLTIGGYVAVVLTVCGLLWQARRWALRVLDQPQAKAEWLEWKAHVVEVQPRADATVKWRVPKSDEPPSLILLRDSFSGVLLGCLVIASFVYAFFVIVLRGMWTSPLQRAPPSDPS